MGDRIFNLQFSMRAMLWSTAIVSVGLVAIKGDAFWAATITLGVGGAALIIQDCLTESEFRIGASQLLVGAAVVACGCLAMFGAAYAKLVDQRSGTLDYITFATGLFALCYAIWVRSAAANQLRLTAIAGYFAFVAGAFMLNYILFDSIIRHLR